jgi:ribosomal protein L2
VARGEAFEGHALAVKLVAGEIRGARSRSRATIGKRGWA